MSGHLKIVDTLFINGPTPNHHKSSSKDYYLLGFAVSAQLEQRTIQSEQVEGINLLRKEWSNSS